MKSWVIAALLAVVPALVRGQQLQGAWWYTEQTGYDFTTSPMRLFDGTGQWPQFNSTSAGTISSASGQLQFFGSSSYQLFNRDYRRLPSLSPWMCGIQEDVEQMVLIPAPDNDKLCYVVQTPGPSASMNRIPCLYSLLDTRLDGGRGEFVTPGLRRSLPGKAAPHLTTAMHANDRDVWAITVAKEGDSLRAWRLGPTGFISVTRSAANTATALFPRTEVGFSWGPGYFLRASPNGELIACGTDSTVELFNFNRTNDQIIH